MYLPDAIKSYLCSFLTSLKSMSDLYYYIIRNLNLMKTRLNALTVSVITVLALFVVLSSCKKETKQLGIATYSVKGLESDIEGSFQALADDGYTVMEIWKYNAGERTAAGYAPADYAALAEKYGLDIISSHAGAKVDVNDIEGTLSAWNTVFDDHKTMGCKYVILPSYSWSNDIEVLNTECDMLNRLGELANEKGLMFGYHNHSIEFAKVPGTDQLYEDFLITHTDPEKVFFQMDVYWTVFGGQDPVAYLKKYPDRIKLLHIKDDYVIGESGNIDFKAIFDQFYLNGFKDWFVEMETEMTPEQIAARKARDEQRRKALEEGPSDPAGPPPARPVAGDLAGQGTPPPPPPPPPAPDPAVIAEQLKTSLEGIRLSAEYLKNAEFVK
jgi:sugar phosphate isomerase/epimerase